MSVGEREKERQRCLEVTLYCDDGGYQGSSEWILPHRISLTTTHTHI